VIKSTWKWCIAPLLWYRWLRLQAIKIN